MHPGRSGKLARGQDGSTSKLQAAIRHAARSLARLSDYAIDR